MKMLPVALQLYTVRNEMEADFEGTLKKVKAMGYEGVEFAGLFGRGAGEINKLLKELELTPVAAHIPFDDMMTSPDQLFDTYAQIGCSYVVLPYLADEYRPGTEGFLKVLGSVERLGLIAKEKGMTLLYHNHDFEFTKLEGEYALDVLYNSVSAEVLQTEIDTCWVNVAGVNPVDYLGKYAGRSPVVHLKDFVMKGKEKPAQMYELIGIQSEAGEKSGEEKFGFRPLGYGVQDVPALLKAAGDAGAKWVVVEQDMPAPGQTPMESAELSIKYLRSLE